MTKKNLLSIIEQFVYECLKDNEPGHDILHVQRVRKMALRLSKTTPCDTMLVEILALLHDIEDHKNDNPHSVSSFLNSLDIDAQLKEKVLYILPYLSFSKYPLLPCGFPIEAKIVSDADRLDAIGAIGIARAFSYGGSKKRPFYGSENSTIKHFDEKLLVLDQYLYLEKSREIAKKRMKVLNSFYDEFLKEIK